MPRRIVVIEAVFAMTSCVTQSLGSDPGEPDHDGTRPNTSGVRAEGRLLAGRQEVGPCRGRTPPSRYPQ